MDKHLTFYLSIRKRDMSELPIGSINNNWQLFCGDIGKEGFNLEISRRQKLGVIL
jgi:hypothetical protein